MVCSIGRERMADTVRLLASGNIPEITSEEATHEKLAVQFIHREFNDADEANLLDEEANKEVIHISRTLISPRAAHLYHENFFNPSVQLPKFE
ncbi:hypothetical protein QJS10_CPA16g01426 [Acorus calamus]|uniref:Uncharacterized protein n=1 Tax=Acorus calamus TaxID=4465 RepID=A0AAV9D1T4_ACOCL|nr:hypothetical protein QJS10_CPA16g01426 [Acorus calamus]